MLIGVCLQWTQWVCMCVFCEEAAQISAVSCILEKKYFRVFLQWILRGVYTNYIIGQMNFSLVFKFFKSMRLLPVVCHANIKNKLKKISIFFCSESYTRYADLFNIVFTLSKPIFMKFWHAVHNFFCPNWTYSGRRSMTCWHCFDFVCIAFQIIYYVWIYPKVMRNIKFLW